MNTSFSERILLALILAVGAALRLWGDFSFMPDEVSALSRLRVDSLSEVINLGVRPDGHPALVQVFLYLFTSLVGHSEWLIKLPSIILGLVSIHLTYAVGKRLFHAHTGLLAAACVATLQYTVLYSQLARPYVFGMFFCLAQMHYLLNLREGKRNRSALIGLSVMMALSAYTHYFSMLCSGLLFLWGWTMILPSQRKSYALAALISMILFLPHIGITVGHLSIGGLGNGGWLDAPTPLFVLDFFSWCFQYSGSVISLVIIFLAAQMWALTKEKGRGKMLLMGISMMIVPLTIGYWYSVTRSPLLQYSVLIFGFPFMLMALFSYASRISKGWTSLVCLLLMTLNVWSFFEERAHPRLMAAQPYDVCAQQIANENKVGISPLVMCDRNPDFLGVYQDRDDLTYQYIQMNANWSLAEFDRHLLKRDNAPLILLNGSPEQEWAARYRSHEVKRMEGLSFSLGLYADNRIKQDKNIGVSLPYSFDGRSVLPWSFDNKQVKDSYLFMREGQEFGLSCEIGLDSLVSSRYSVICFSMEAEIPLTKHPSLSHTHRESGVMVIELIDQEGTSIWTGRPAHEGTFYPNTEAISLVGVRLQDLISAEEDLSSYTVKLYYWNKGLKPMNIDWVQVDILSDNPDRYSLFRPRLIGD